ncbi:hypothetical protein [Nostoc sp. ChiSLP03a]|uniref:hypothetical protein n=1 Tax=Nostoc sp. ChiSLP03a TaxID=3075380 RepID=UPI002AD34512|nr:hypothetical protein [Nostoc sp. ChiSLP03a]MDZ8213048.1 hypothetical protein [Nostoc sp. ChiSLP03a]
MIPNLFFTDLLSYFIEKGSSRKQSDIYDEICDRISCHLTLLNYYPFISLFIQVQVVAIAQLFKGSLIIFTNQIYDNFWKLMVMISPEVNRHHSM